MDAPSPFDDAHRRLERLGVRLERLPGEYRVNFSGGKEAEWAYFEDLGSATSRGEQMAAERPLEPPMGRRRRIGERVYRSAKAQLKAVRKAHNRKVWADVMGKIISKQR